MLGNGLGGTFAGDVTAAGSLLPRGSFGTVPVGMGVLGNTTRLLLDALPDPLLVAALPPTGLAPLGTASVGMVGAVPLVLPLESGKRLPMGFGSLPPPSTDASPPLPDPLP